MPAIEKDEFEYSEGVSSATHNDDQAEVIETFGDGRQKPPPSIPKGQQKKVKTFALPIPNFYKVTAAKRDGLESARTERKMVNAGK